MNLIGITGITATKCQKLYNKLKQVKPNTNSTIFSSSSAGFWWRVRRVCIDTTDAGGAPGGGRPQPGGPPQVGLPADDGAAPQQRAAGGTGRQCQPGPGAPGGSQRRTSPAGTVASASGPSAAQPATALPNDTNAGESYFALLFRTSLTEDGAQWQMVFNLTFYWACFGETWVTRWILNKD